MSLWTRFFGRPPAVEALPRTFSLPERTRVYAVGDIHCRTSLLETLMERIRLDALGYAGDRIVEIYLGDYVDRGHESRRVIDLLIAPPPGHVRVCLMGNHEEALLEFLDNPSTLRRWGTFGGYATLASYGIGIPESMAPGALIAVRDRFAAALPAEHLAFLRQLPDNHTLGEYHFVHAGVAPDLSLAQQTREHRLWIREGFLKHRAYFSHYVVHGHTPVIAPELLHHRANLDISNAPTDSLCCLVIAGETKKLITVNDVGD
jgi:serine/threonine protein phosphatase 1